jgi:hypothetical protein
VGIASAVGLYILVAIFSSGSESSARWKILILAIGSVILQGLLMALFPNLWGVVGGVLLSLALIAAGLTFWCGIERLPVIKIMGSYIVLCVALVLIFAILRPTAA